MSPNNKRQNNHSNSNKNNSRSRMSTRSQKAITKDKKDAVIADAYNSYKPPKNLRPNQQEAELEDVNMEDGTAESSSKNDKETTRESPQQGAAANDRQDEPINDKTSKSDDDDDQDFQIVDRNRGYRAGAPAEKIKGKSNPEKLQTVAKHFLKCKGYAG